MSVDLDVMGGTPCFAGSRVPIAIVMASLDQGVDLRRLQECWPFMTDAHVSAAQRFAEQHPDVLSRLVAWPAASYVARLASLRLQSNDHLAFATASAASGELTRASSSAIQAGYCALLSTLSMDEVRAHLDHPSGRAAALGTERLGLSPEDRAFGVRVAENFYGPHPDQLWSFEQCLAWAQRARAAAGWDG